MSNEDIAKMILDKLRGGRLIAMLANQGPIPSFTLQLENDKEERASLTFQPGIQTQVQSGSVEIKARIEINVADWRK